MRGAAADSWSSARRTDERGTLSTFVATSSSSTGRRATSRDASMKRMSSEIVLLEAPPRIDKEQHRGERDAPRRYPSMSDAHAACSGLRAPG